MRKTYNVEITNIRDGVTNGEEFDTMADAIHDAKVTWNHFTSTERKKYTVEVYIYYLDENGDAVDSECVWSSEYEGA